MPFQPDAFTVEDLEQALRSAGVGVWAWDMATGLVRWSEVTYQVYEIAPAEFTGAFASFSERIHPDDAPRVSATIMAAVQSAHQDYHIEHRLLLPGGRIKWLEGRGRVLLDADGKPSGMIGTVKDITEHKRDEALIRKAEKSLRLFTEHATDYVYEATVEGSVAIPEIVAGSFERTTGLDVDEVAARGGWLNCMHPEDRERALEVLAVLLQGRSALNEYRIIDGDGRVHWLRDRVVPVRDERGKVIKLVGGVSDITQQRALEERLLESQRMEALARLAAGVAHDFNNLLTVLMAETCFLKAPEATPEIRKRSLEQIDATLERAAHLTSSLLAFGRKRVGPMIVIDLAEAVLHSRPMLSRAAGEKVLVQVEIEAPHVQVVADANDIHLVLLNLTLNARDAMAAGGRVDILVGVAELPAQEAEGLMAVASGRYARVLVKDEGPGVAPEAVSRIFEPYFTTKGHGGTGLGLPTCLSIVRRYGGALRLKETGPGGSTFEMLLPLTSQPLATPAQPPAAVARPGAGLLVGVVEDDDVVRAVIQRALEAQGYVVSAFGSAEALLESDVAASMTALVTDFRLPGRSGVQLAQQLRTRRPNVPILVISGHVEDQAQQAQLAKGEFPFLAKPFSASELCRRLGELLAHVEAS